MTAQRVESSTLRAVIDRPYSGYFAYSDGFCAKPGASLLEGQLQGELQLARCSSSAINLPRSCVEHAGCIANRPVRNAEIHPVKHIESFKPELQFGFFNNV